ncbi:hypothetical protein Y1Q_0004239 [Alligator mississippiensis]|uniref:Uncharacterized protein n=1 Tax=Alligator mississippiensis TaxID=8496 RepID=A0A151NDA0_ALLMI|nr:hypothetical protein Y1Q_0004239 [Alligator mississippiensis]
MLAALMRSWPAGQHPHLPQELAWYEALEHRLRDENMAWKNRSQHLQLQKHPSLVRGWHTTQGHLRRRRRNGA